MAGLTVGVIIGRFQVPALHEGHLHLFNEVAGKSDRVVMLLGISPLDGHAAEYPLTFSQRTTMIDFSLGMTTKRVVVLPLPDRATDAEWSTQIDVMLGAMHPSDNVTLYGGRDSFTEHYKGKYPVERINPLPVIAVAGTEIRKCIKEANESEFLRGQIHALNRQYPHAFPTVDIAHLRTVGAENEVLLIQRTDTGQWCFPGGFVDPTDESLDGAARRELREEVGLRSESELAYIGSCRMNDWRYRGSRDQIITTLFLSYHSFGRPTLKPDEVQDFKWVIYRYDSATDHVADVHKPLMTMLQQFMKGRIL